MLNSLELARSFGAKVWDHSPLQMKQIDQVGVVAVRKLAASGIMSLEELEFTEPHQIEMTLSKNPPFGTKLLARVREFPKLRVALKITGRVCQESTQASLWLANMQSRRSQPKVSKSVSSWKWHL